MAGGWYVNCLNSATYPLQREHIFPLDYSLDEQATIYFFYTLWPIAGQQTTKYKMRQRPLLGTVISVWSDGWGVSLGLKGEKNVKLSLCLID
jgi:hypothetical protein